LKESEEFERVKSGETEVSLFYKYGIPEEMILGWVKEDLYSFIDSIED
jgi:hypothetical protein